nr:DMT family transporter [Thermoflavimicrobium dichotomicum]
MQKIGKCLKVPRWIYGLLVTVVVMIWGFNVIALKVLVHHFDPVTMTSFRIFVAGFVVFVMMGLIGKLKKLTWTEMKLVGAAGLFNVVFHHFFLAIGLTLTTASNSGLILGTLPLLTALMSMKFLGDRFTWFRGLGILFGLLGVSFIVLNGKSHLGQVSIGDFYVFLAALSQAISFILVKRASNTMDVRVLTGWMFLFGSAVLFLVSLAIEPHGLARFSNGNIQVWLLFLCSAIFATGLGHMIYNKSLQRLGATEAAIFTNLSPFFTLIGSYFFLNEPITFAQMSGFVLIILGVILGSGVINDQNKTQRMRKEQDQAI